MKVTAQEYPKSPTRQRNFGVGTRLLRNFGAGIIIGLAVMVTIPSSGYAQRANTVGVLVEKCLKLPILGIPELATGLTTRDIVQTASCANFFDAATLMHDRMETETGTKLWCQGLSNLQIADIVKIFIAWASNNTDMLTEPGLDGIVQALSEAFPCAQA